MTDIQGLVVMSAKYAARAAMTSVKDMHHTTTFEAINPHSIARTEFATMAQAADECITKVAGLDTIGEQAVRRENTSLLTQMIAWKPGSSSRQRADLADSRPRPQRTPNDRPGVPVMTPLERTLAKALTEITCWPGTDVISDRRWFPSR